MLPSVSRILHGALAAAVATAGISFCLCGCFYLQRQLSRRSEKLLQDQSWCGFTSMHAVQLWLQSHKTSNRNISLFPYGKSWLSLSLTLSKKLTAQQITTCFYSFWCFGKLQKHFWQEQITMIWIIIRQRNFFSAIFWSLLVTWGADAELERNIFAKSHRCGSKVWGMIQHVS